MRLSGTKTSSTSRGLGNTLWDIAGSRPTLDLDFANNKSLVDNTTGQNLITFTRAAGPATYFNSSGILVNATTDEPRFDHNPTTGESLGLLVEEQRTNLFTRSEEFGTAWSTLNSSISADATVAPNGTLTADKIVENSTNNIHGVSRGGGSESLVNGTVYTFSVYAKAAERSFVWLQALNSFAKSYFNLSTGVVSASGAGHTSTITPAGNGWYRCAITFTSDQTNNSYRAIGMSQVSGTESYAGDNASGIFLWGAQLEAGAFPTSYIPTTTAAATRNADVASITGTNFSSWYRQDEGTVFAEFGPYGNGGASRNSGLVQIDSGSATNTIRMFCGSTVSPVLAVDDSSVNQAYISFGTLTPSVTSRIAGAFKVNDFARVINGLSPDTDSGGTVPTLNRMLIGSGTAGVAELCGTIRRLTYWPQRLSNTTLQQITS